MSQPRRFHLVTLGCARNEVDSDELAGRLTADGWDVSEGASDADVVLVNTCGFIDAAKTESISTILDISDGATVVATGCLAERYGSDLADELPEAAAVLGFDTYPKIAATLEAILAGESVPSHQPRDRRSLLPVTPVHRRAATAHVPGHDAAVMLGGASQRILRRRLQTGPVAALKIASGCDRRCAFCAIPAFRGAFVSRPAADVVAEARALAADGVSEVVLVSENSTAYGKDLPEGPRLDGLLRQLDDISELQRIRVSYLQPAELRPAVLDAMAGLDRVAPSFDVSFQHASGQLLRRMRRFGDADSFLSLIADVRTRTPEAGIRSNVIVGFPGETEEDLAVLTDFLSEARLDAVGVFGYSDEDGTEAYGLRDKVDPDEIAERVAMVQELVDVVSADRAAQRIGTRAELLVEHPSGGIVGRTEFQGPEDGGCRWTQGERSGSIGELVPVKIVASDGVDLVVAREG
jgi:ribosomal protein S12 methylthiotransferase